MAEPILSLEGVTKRFGGLTAVSGVSLAVERGEICGFIGPNGAGKSTLFNLISGLFTASSGQIVFEGRDITALPLHRRARDGIARTFQLAHTFPTLSVEDNVLVGAERHHRLGLVQALTHLGSFRRDEEDARLRTRDAMAIAGVAAISDLPGSQLTFGQQRLVATARALAARPSMLLLDEPAAGLSGGDIEHLAGAVLRARDAGTTVLIVEHNMDVIMRLCGHVVVMHLGEKIGDGSPAEIRSSARVLEAYLGA